MFAFGQKPAPRPTTRRRSRRCSSARSSSSTDPGIPADEDKAIAAYRDFLDGDARRHRSAPRRCAGWATSRWPAPTTPTPSRPRRAARPTTARPSRSTATTSRPIRTTRATTACSTSSRGRRSRAAQLEQALKTLDSLVATYPQTRYRDEAQFRRGELLFTLRQYPKAEQAYAMVLTRRLRSARTANARCTCRAGPGSSRAASKRRCGSFFGVLDGKIAGIRDDDLDKSEALSRADKELVDDTLRVIEHLAGQPARAPESIPAYITSDDAPRVRVPRLPAARAAVPEAGAPEGRRRHLRRLRAPEPARRAGAGACRRR